MARIDITEEVLIGDAPTLPLVANSADLNWIAQATPGDGVAIVRNNGRKLLLVRNNHATNPGTVTITQAKPARGRTVDMGPYTLQAGEISIFGYFPSSEYNQDAPNAGKVFIAGSTADMQFAVLPMGELD